ncbi:MAG: hypothetical protein ACYC7E_18155 [Armatimonadota bacterium]
MAKNQAPSIESGLSLARLQGYRDATLRGGDVEAIALYLWNVVLSEALFPALQYIEICLRNSMHAALTRYTQQSDWYDIPFLLHPDEAGSIADIKQRLLIARKPVNPDNIVAGSTLGLWVGLLRPHYNDVLWPRLHGKVFPHAPVMKEPRRKVMDKLKPIHRLRNRVFHHETIWKTRDLPNMHNDILTLICWMNPPVCALLRTADRFPSVHSGGHAAFLPAALALLSVPVSP